jgi:Uri superfamily endonuclease
LIGATDGAATSMLEHIKRELLFNPNLGCDFREVCYPLRCLQGNSRRCVGQLWRGQQTLIEWGADRLTFPTISPSKVSGGTLTVRGLTGSIRGQSSTLATGEIIRPEIVIIDDPNTRESAFSKLQTKQRLDIVLGDVLGMNGPNTTIAAVMPCTVIAPGDMADQLLNRELFPEWQGERTQLVYSFPTNTALWHEYRDMRAADFRSGGDGTRATRFYAEHRDEMDVGAVVSWPERYNENELSAIQHAMNLKFRGEQSFMSEYQNSPELPQTSGDKVLSAEEIRKKVNGRHAGEVPTAAIYLSAAVDCHDNVLFYAVCAWQPDFTGFVIEYGRLGVLAVQPGFYVYVGSAFGPGGLAKRVGRHARAEKKCRWHIDYLTAVATLDEVWHTLDDAHWECQWASGLKQIRGATVPLDGFGSSDCRCPSHLFYFQKRPSLRVFRQRLARSLQGLGPIRTERSANIVRTAAADVARRPGPDGTRR